MRDYIILTDSDSELLLMHAQEKQIPVFRMPFMLDGVEYDYDLGEEVHIPDFFQRLADGATFSTSCKPPWVIKEWFRGFLDQGLDILYIGFSHALSNHFPNAMMAAEELLAENNDARIVLVDTLSISLGQAQLVLRAVALKEQGNDLDAVHAWLEENIQHSIVYFIVDDLNYLRRGGRLSRASAIMGTVLDIKPILHTSETGRLVPVDKIKGRKKAIRHLVEIAKERGNDWENSPLLIAYAEQADGEYIEAMVHEQIPQARTELWPIGPVIGGHTGPGALGISFFGTSR